MKAESDMNFEAKDFARYYSGEMSGKEMYALEKAALADPFLQDALEGYAHSENPVADINELQEKLAKRIGEKTEAKVVSFSKNNFLKAAVLIAFLAGAAVIFLTQQNTRIENNELASTSPAEFKEVKVDSNQTSGQNDVAVQETTNSATSPIVDLKRTEENKIAANEKPAKREMSKPTVMAEQSVQDEISVAAAPILKNEKAKEGILVTGKVVNVQGEPVSFASIVTNKEQINTDIAGNYSAYIKDSSLYGNVVAAGYMNSQNKLNPNQPQTIILNYEIDKSDKIAADSRLQSAKKAAVSAKELASGNAEAKMVNALVPKVGWPEYEKYLKDSVRYQNDKRAFVQITFTVNELGRPQDIKVIDGLCLPCNTEAIRLLKSGPDWKPDPKGKGLLKVQF